MDLKPWCFGKSFDKYVAQTIKTVQKEGGDFIEVVTRSPANLKITVTMVPKSKIHFVLHFQFYKRPHEMLFINGICLVTSVLTEERCKEIYENLTKT